MMQEDLIFDIGCNNGDDSDFYLRKGFRVVAIDAARDLCDLCESRFTTAIRNQRMTVVCGAISDQPGSTVTFYKNEKISDWNSLDPYFVERNAKAGAASIAVTVPTVSMDELFKQHGMPYYLKIDIEGADIVPLFALVGKTDLPQYISLEIADHDFTLGLEQIATLGKIGYEQFLFVNQGMRRHVRAPREAREGKYADYDPSTVSTGLFGKDLDGKWLDIRAAVARFQEISRLHALFRDHKLYSRDGKLGGTLISKIHNRFRRHILKDPVAWYDLHARR